MAPPRDRLTIYFDGGCRPNPGPMETALVLRGTVHVRRDLGEGDSGIAEWLALRHAAERAIAAGAADVLLVGDARTVIRQALAWDGGRLSGRSDRLWPYRCAAMEVASAIPRLHLRWVRRSRNPAGVALDRGRPAFPVDLRPPSG